MKVYNRDWYRENLVSIASQIARVPYFIDTREVAYTLFSAQPPIEEIAAIEDREKNKWTFIVYSDYPIDSYSTNFLRQYKRKDMTYNIKVRKQLFWIFFKTIQEVNI